MDVESTLLAVRRDGGTITEAIKLIREIEGISVGDAKALVTASRVWNADAAAGDALHAEIEEAIVTINPEGFHDATFLGADVRWPERVTVLKFRLHPDREVWLRARDFSSVSIPRSNPWGASESVNRLRWEAEAGVVEVEMQSGDTIRVVAAGFAMEAPE